MRRRLLLFAVSPRKATRECLGPCLSGTATACIPFVPRLPSALLLPLPLLPRASEARFQLPLKFLTSYFRVLFVLDSFGDENQLDSQSLWRVDSVAGRPFTAVSL
ncbi:hypothetical protein TRVL_05254 [Trypanosoma vivax]|nr:hypothetical protein TRVL_05254 [Trypanosoma vivax]